MYKILNYLFGWDYISCDSGAYSYSDDVRIFRILRTPNGDVGFFTSKTMGHTYFKKLKPSDEIAWLTCPKEKYFTEPQS